MERIVRALGKILLGLGVIVMALGHILTIYYDGWERYTEIMSPYNVANYVVTLVILAPGAFLIWLADWLAERKRRPH